MVLSQKIQKLYGSDTSKFSALSRVKSDIFF